MLTSLRWRRAALYAVAFFEAILILVLTFADRLDGFAFGFAVVMVVFVPVMFFVDRREEAGGARSE